MTITAQTAKTGPYNGNGSTTTFSYSFKVSSAAHLVVTVLGTDGSTESIKVLNTDYTVTGVGSPSGGTIVMGTAPVTGEKLTITRNVTLDQEVDLQNRGAVNPETLEESLDKLTQISQDQQEQLDRSLKVDLFEQADLDQLTLNVNALAAIAPNISTVAGISADVTAVAADATDIGVVSANITNVNTVAGISSDVTAVVADEVDIGVVATDLTGDNTIGTVAGIAANVTTVAGISADVTAVAADATDIGTVSANITNVNTVAGISGNVTTVAGISANVTAVAADATDIGTVSANITNVNTVAGISANVTTVAGISADVTAVAGDATDIGTVSANITNVNTVAGISGDVTTVAADGTDIGTVATNIANVNTVAGISAAVTTVAADGTDIGTVATSIADVNTVAGISGNVTTVAGISGNVTTVAGISADVTAVAGDATDIGTVSANIANVNTVAGISAAVTTVAADGTDIGAVAANSTNINTVAAISGNVTTVANVSADVTTAATNIAAIIAAPAEASAASASASAASVSETNALAHRNDAQSARDQSQAARDTAEDHKLAAEAAATSATNTAAALTGFDLDAIAATKAVTAVDVFVYDTSRDSDGGAWRKRTQHTSWYNETLDTATRGARREFPAVAVIVAESNKVTIYDGDDPALPMWMVFNLLVGSGFWNSSTPATSLFMRDATIAVGSNAVGFRQVNFVSEKFVRAFTSSLGGQSGGIINRNATLVSGPSDGPIIVNSAVNDVAMTVLPDAPIDPATGLPVPTIAVATAGGVSVIKDDGTVVSDSALFFAGHGTASKCHIFGENLYVTSWNGLNQNNLGVLDIRTLSELYRYTAFPSLYTSPTPFDNQNLSRLTYSNDQLYIGTGTTGGLTAKGVGIIAENTSAPTSGMSALLTSTYNTGWMAGDIKGAFLSDTDDTDLVGSGELVTNGTFDTDLTGWNSLGGTHSVGADGVELESDESGFPAIRQQIATVAGKRYIISFSSFITGYAPSSNNAFFVRRNSADSAELGLRQNCGTASKTNFSFEWVASQDNEYIQLLHNRNVVEAGDIAYFDNVSVKLADADRSVNNKGLIVNGTVTRTPVASGADLVSYSGWSA